MKTKIKKYHKVIDLITATSMLEDMKNKFICDNCKKSFKGIKALMEENNNISFGGINMVKSLRIKNKIYYLVSPCCKITHLFGFDKLKI